MEKPIQPVLLGGDMNCYTMARAFHEAYSVPAKAFGRYPMGETKYSRIVDFTAVEDIDTDPVMVNTLTSFAAQHPGTTKILLGCTDDYAAMLIRNRDVLSKEYIVPYIGADLMEKLVSKASFYEYCDQFNIPYPDTVLFRPGEDLSLFERLPFAYPIIIKPSSSIEYWKHPFPDMKKVYIAKDANEAKQITLSILSSGYSDKLIIQDKIPGGDWHMRVLTAYCDRNAKVKMVCLGHVLLEEHTPKALGNHAAILTEYDRPLMQKLADFLEAIQFTGFANFDIKYDERDKKFKVFEINLRQGRSNYYVTGAGLNLARYLVEDRVQEKDLGESLFYEGESFWHSIPAPIVWEYVGDRQLVDKAKAIVQQGKDTTALGYDYDLHLNPLRWLYLKIHYQRYYKKYQIHCPKP